MGKKSSAPKVQESANEKALAEVSKARRDRYRSLYRPVEQNFQEEVAKDTSALLGGRAVADVAQAADDSMGDAVALGRGSASQLGSTAKSLGDARTMAVVGANKTAQEIKDKGQLGALKIGNDMATDAVNGMAVAARASNTEAVAKARAQAVENDAFSTALGQIAMGGVQGYQHRKGLSEIKANQDAMRQRLKSDQPDWDASSGMGRYA